jgi:signal transduction histidine kinase
VRADVTTRSPRSTEALSRALGTGQHVLFGSLLLLAWARAAGDSSWFEVAAASLGVLYATLIVSEARDARQQSRTTPWTYAVLVLLLAAWSISVLLTPDFSWLAFPLFFVVLRLVPSRPALGLVAALVAVVVWSHARVTGWSDLGLAAVIGPSVGALVSVGMATAYRMLLRENAARQQLVDQLMASQRDLEATLEQLADSRRQAGVLEERGRLARDIHDTLAQGFSSIVLLSRAATHSGADTPDLLARIERQATESLGDAREVVAALTPESLSHGDLATALERVVASAGEEGGIRATFEVDGSTADLPRAHEVALLRLAQGALANVMAHAAAERVAVSLSVDDEGTRLDVVDDGRGFDPDSVGPREDGSGYGLRSMRERIASLGGRLTIESAPGEGTAVAVSLPVPTASGG